jgi:hypothetical protein
MSDRTLGRARGLNSIADPSDFKGSRGRRVRPEAGDDAAPPPPSRSEDRASEPAPAEPTAPPPIPHRAVVPGLQRTRRELSVPIPVAEAVAATGINPADVVMSAYRRHGDAIYAGAGGRMVARGRERLRLSISDAEFDKLTRLGEARGWNRSETVSVLLTLELLTPPDSLPTN